MPRRYHNGRGNCEGMRARLILKVEIYCFAAESIPISSDRTPNGSSGRNRLDSFQVLQQFEAFPDSHGAFKILRICILIQTAEDTQHAYKCTPLA